MSGIVALWRRDGSPVEPGLVARMADAAGHRARDGMDTWRSPDGAMAAAHLHFWTTPEEVGERQPLVDDGVALVWDGRLDNRADLAAALGDGAPRPSAHAPSDGASDAALVLAAYRRWGERALGRLRGPFALAVLDARRGGVLLARDRMGRRALCWSLRGRTLLVASEPWSILADADVPDALDETWLACYFALEAPTDGRTIYRAVRELGAGEAMWVTPDATRTWQHDPFDPTTRLSYARDEDYAAHFLDLLRTAVRRRMRAPETPAVLMSGGLDSAPVAALAAEAARALAGAPAVRTFSYVFDAFPASDERAYIEAVAAHCGLDATLVTADGAWPMRDLDDWAVNPNGPEGNFYRNLMDLVLGAAHAAGARVLLAGYAGDGLYAGAQHWLADLLAEGRLREAWAELRVHAARHGWGAVARSHSVRHVLGLARRALGRGARPLAPPAWLTPEAAARVAAQPPALPWSTRARRPEHVDQLMGPATTAGAYMGALGVTRHGIEIRDPYGDRDVTEFAALVPAYVLYNKGRLKHVMRRAMLGILPEPVRTRPAATRFTPLLEHALKSLSSEIVQRVDRSESSWGPYVQSAWLRAAPMTASGVDPRELVIWRAISLDTWLARRPDRPSSSLPRLSPLVVPREMVGT